MLEVGESLTLAHCERYCLWLTRVMGHMWLRQGNRQSLGIDNKDTLKSLRQLGTSDKTCLIAPFSLGSKKLTKQDQVRYLCSFPSHQSNNKVKWSLTLVHRINPDPLSINQRKKKPRIRRNTSTTPTHEHSQRPELILKYPTYLFV